MTSHLEEFVLVALHAKLVVYDGDAGLDRLVVGVQLQALLVVLQREVELILPEEAVWNQTAQH